MIKKLLIALLMLVAIAVPAYAFTSFWYEMAYLQQVAGIAKEPLSGNVLLSDGTSYLLLSDGTNKITLV